MQFLIFNPSFPLCHHTGSIVPENVRLGQGYDSGLIVPKNLRPAISLHNFHILPFKQYVKHYHGKKHKHCKRHNYLLVFRSAITSFTTSAGPFRPSDRPRYISLLNRHICPINHKKTQKAYPLTPWDRESESRINSRTFLGQFVLVFILYLYTYSSL